MCWWEDDPVQFEKPDLPGGANRFSLREAKENYARLGISDPALKRYQQTVPGIRFSYRVMGSWAVANIADERHGCKMVPTYLSDALCNLVRAVNRIFEIGQAYCSWADEPGEWLWSFERTGNQVHIRVRRFRQWNLGKARDENSETWRRDFDRVLFDATCDLVSLAKEIDRALKSLLLERNMEQYCLDWHHPFPEMEVEQLRRYIKDMHTT